MISQTLILPPLPPAAAAPAALRVAAVLPGVHNQSVLFPIVSHCSAQLVVIKNCIVKSKSSDFSAVLPIKCAGIVLSTSPPVHAKRYTIVFLLT